MITFRSTPPNKYLKSAHESNQAHDQIEKMEAQSTSLFWNGPEAQIPKHRCSASKNNQLYLGTQRVDGPCRLVWDGIADPDLGRISGRIPALSGRVFGPGISAPSGRIGFGSLRPDFGPNTSALSARILGPGPELGPRFWGPGSVGQRRKASTMAPALGGHAAR